MARPARLTLNQKINASATPTRANAGLVQRGCLHLQMMTGRQLVLEIEQGLLRFVHPVARCPPAERLDGSWHGYCLWQWLA
jgi:hypothetical protein